MKISFELYSLIHCNQKEKKRNTDLVCGAFIASWLLSLGGHHKITIYGEICHFVT